MNKGVICLVVLFSTCCSLRRIGWSAGLIKGKKKNSFYYIIPREGIEVYSEPYEKSKVVGKLAQSLKIKVLQDTNIPIEKSQSTWAEIIFKKKKGYINFSKLSKTPIVKDYEFEIESGKVGNLNFRVTSDEQDYRGVRLFKIKKNGKLFCQKKLSDFLRGHWKNSYIYSYHLGYGETEYSEEIWGEFDIRTCKKKDHSYSLISVQTFEINGKTVVLESYENETIKRDTLLLETGKSTIILAEEKKIEVIHSSGLSIQFRFGGKNYSLSGDKIIPTEKLKSTSLKKIQID